MEKHHPKVKHLSCSSWVLSCTFSPISDSCSSLKDPNSGLWSSVFSMHFSTGPSSNSWQPVVLSDSTEAYYWLKWRVLLCALWVLASMLAASILIWKFEGSGTVGEAREGFHCNEDELWRPCLPEIHPAWLLLFRLTAFVILLAFLIINVIVDGAGIFYYYTQ